MGLCLFNTNGLEYVKKLKNGKAPGGNNIAPGTSADILYDL